MAGTKTAKIAVSSVTFAIDRPYEYVIPDSLLDKIMPGHRVVVPFGTGNHRREGIVLSFGTDTGEKKLKAIDSLLDDDPVLTDDQIKLALWMRDRFFCTVYDAVHAMLPSGMWYKDGAKRIGDKTQRFAVLAVSGEEALEAAEEKRRKSPRQADVLTLLASVGEASTKEISYFTGAGAAVFPALKKQGLITIEDREVFRRPEKNYVFPAAPVVLNCEQEAAFRGIKELSEAGEAKAALLYGVTGSGKTVVYISLIKDLLEREKSSIILVPEIALTPQLVSIFSSHFGDEVAVLHSSLSIGERYDEWKRIKSGGARVVVGTRSAVFAPVENLGAIIIDEEQEHTYKSENQPRYHARDVAKYRCARTDSLLLLGSATPSVDTMKNAVEGRYTLFELKHRFNEGDLPPVQIADMKEELRAGNGGSISALLETELRANMERGEQSILFINRRGAFGLVVCGECGHTFECPKCSVSMTYHLANNRLMCHYCGHSEPVPAKCPDCGGKIKFTGAGTQQVEKELCEKIPGIRVIRMDVDTVSPVRSHDKLLTQFREERADVLLGTQMVAKGLDFPNVTLVGVISADQSLYINDYRANERTFSLITQVVGRSGRGEKSGRAIIQTFTPENETIMLAAGQDYMGFFERETQVRKVLDCPPYKDMIVVTVQGPEEDAVREGSMKMRNSLCEYLKNDETVSVLGPAPAPIVKMNYKYRYRITVMCRNTKLIRDTVSHLVRTFCNDKANRRMTAAADLDPLE